MAMPPRHCTRFPKPPIVENTHTMTTARTSHQQILEQAVQHHNAGRFPEAEKCYRQVLQADPDQPVALHLLGMIAFQSGNVEAAIELVSKALNIKPDFAEAHNTFGIVLKNAGRLDDAMASYKKAIAITPAYTEAHYNLGNALQEQGNSNDAVESYKAAIATNPTYIDAHINLGNSLRILERFDEAQSVYKQVLSINPNHADAHNNLGNVYLEQQNLAAAAGSYRQAIALNPAYAKAHSNLGNVLHNQGQLDDAATCFKQAIAIDPQNAELHFNLGNTLTEADRLEGALACYLKAVSIDDNFEKAHFALGSAFLDSGKLDLAVAAYSKAIILKPDFAEAHVNLGNAFKELRQIENSVESFQKAIAIDPQMADAHFNLGNSLLLLGRLDEARASFEKTLLINPDFAEAYNNLANALHDLGLPKQAMDACKKALEIKPDYSAAHSNMIFIEDFVPGINQARQQQERNRWNENFILPLADKIKPHTNTPDAQRLLRIGYVSADFRRHSACLGFAQLILDFDRQNFEVICYDGSEDTDDISQALRDAASQWRDIKQVDDAKAAQTIIEDKIDILVDLSGHTRGNRLKVFGYKPAPIQLTGIGHLAPGLSCIDYRLTTAHMTPPDEQDIYPEAPIYLDTYFGFTPPDDAPPVGACPHLENGFITFGYLGRYSKVSDPLLARWAAILQAVPASRLLLKLAQLDDPASAQRIRQTLAASGVAEDRLILLGKSPQRQHLEAHNRVDIVFDSVPHGGGITTLESLWMGVPVIGLSDKTKAGGRIIDSICGPLDLEEWVSQSSDQYQAIAIEMAARSDLLSKIRGQLRGRVSNVFGRFHKDVESSYREIWKHWCAGNGKT